MKQVNQSFIIAIERKTTRQLIQTFYKFWLSRQFLKRHLMGLEHQAVTQICFIDFFVVDIEGE